MIPEINEKYAGKRYFIGPELREGANEVAARMGKDISVLFGALEMAEVALGPMGSTRKGNMILRPTAIYDGADHTLRAVVKENPEPVMVGRNQAPGNQKMRLQRILYLAYVVEAKPETNPAENQ